VGAFDSVDVPTQYLLVQPLLVSIESEAEFFGSGIETNTESKE
jgi:hypothetical protein